MSALYARLRNAVLMYDSALRAYGVLGNAWVEHSDQLDALWARVIDATSTAPSELGACDYCGHDYHTTDCATDECDCVVSA